MLSDKIRILDFDGSVTGQKQLCERFKPSISQLRDIGPASRIWLNGRTAQKIRGALKSKEKNFITFIGSGDFHHVSSLLIEQFSQPICVIVFDHHPDWDIMPPKLGCGSWVTHTLKKTNISKLVLLGVSSEDISSKWIYTANLASLRNDKVEVYPYSHEPTNVLLKAVPQNSSIRLQRGIFMKKIIWNELKGQDLPEFFRKVLSALPVKQVYVSIDKDCLKKEYSLTNWEEGRLGLEELLLLLKLIRENTEIAGLDIIGDYSLPQAAGRIKSFCARLDHPADYSAKGHTPLEITAVNEKTNIRILELLLS